MFGLSLDLGPGSNRIVTQETINLLNATVDRASTRTVSGYASDAVIADGESLLTVPADTLAMEGYRLTDREYEGASKFDSGELVVNGDFSTGDITGWTENAAWTVVDGVASGSASGQYLRQTITGFKIGKEYTIACEAWQDGSSVVPYFRIGTTDGGSDILNRSVGAVSTPRSVGIKITATQDTYYITILVAGSGTVYTSGATATSQLIVSPTFDTWNFGVPDWWVLGTTPNATNYIEQVVDGVRVVADAGFRFRQECLVEGTRYKYRLTQTRTSGYIALYGATAITNGLLDSVCEGEFTAGAGTSLWIQAVLDKVATPIDVTIHSIEVWPIYDQFVGAIKEGELTNCVMIGDSLTAGGSVDYYLKERYQYNANITNAGVSGNTTGQMWARWATDVLALSPDCVIIWGGVNDLRTAAPAATVLANIELMVNSAIANNITPILISPPPAKGYFDWTLPDDQDQMDAYIPLLVAYAEANNIALLNAYDLLVDVDGETQKPEFTLDWLHLTGLGYQYVADAVAPLIPFTASPLPDLRGLNVGISGQNSSTADDIVMVGTPSIWGDSLAHNIRWTPDATGQTGVIWGSYVDASNYIELQATATTLILRNRAGGVNHDTAAFSYTHTAEQLADIQVYAGASGLGVRAADDSITAEVFATGADTTAPSLAATMTYGSINGGQVAQGTFLDLSYPVAYASAEAAGWV